MPWNGRTRSRASRRPRETPRCSASRTRKEASRSAIGSRRLAVISTSWPRADGADGSSASIVDRDRARAVVEGWRHRRTGETPGASRRRTPVFRPFAGFAGLAGFAGPLDGSGTGSRGIARSALTASGRDVPVRRRAHLGISPARRSCSPIPPPGRAAWPHRLAPPLGRTRTPAPAAPPRRTRTRTRTPAPPAPDRHSRDPSRARSLQ